MTKKSLTAEADDKMFFVHFGNEDWNLVLHMLFGIRMSVHSVMHEEIYMVTEAEFNAKHFCELESMFEDSGAAKYEFFDFAPRVFHLIRNFYNVSHE